MIGDVLEILEWRWWLLRRRARDFVLYTVLRRPRPEPELHVSIAELVNMTMTVAGFFAVIKSPETAKVIRGASEGLASVFSTLLSESGPGAAEEVPDRGDDREDHGPLDEERSDERGDRDAGHGQEPADEHADQVHDDSDDGRKDQAGQHGS